MLRKIGNFFTTAIRHQKRWFAKWHTLAGVLAGGVLVVVSLTGAILVFEQELDAWLNPEYFGFPEADSQKAPLGFESITEKVRSQIGTEELLFLYVDHKRNGAYLGYLEPSEKQVVINPYTGAITGRRVYAESFTGFTRNLHRTLLIPEVGKYLVGVSSLMCLVLMVTGLRLWVPKKLSQLRSRLTVKRTDNRKRLNYDLHNTTGFWFSPFISILSATGAVITFNQFFILALFLVSFSVPQSLEKILGARSTYQAGKPPIGIPEIEKIIAGYKPEGRIEGYNFPTDSAGVFSVDVREERPYLAEGHRSRISLDQYSGEILFSSDRDVPPPSRLYVDWVTPLHFGTFGGLTTRLIALVAALATAAMFITGFIIWLPRWSKSKKAASAPAEPYREALSTEP